MPRKYPEVFEGDVVAIAQWGDLSVVEVAADFDLWAKTIYRWSWGLRLWSPAGVRAMVKLEPGHQGSGVRYDVDERKTKWPVRQIR